MVAPCGTRKRFREIFRFLPGLHGARRTEASQPMQKQHGSRDEGNTAHTLHAIHRRVVFRCRIFVPLTVSTSFINNTYFPPATTLLVLDEAKKRGCIFSQLR